MSSDEQNAAVLECKRLRAERDEWKDLATASPSNPLERIAALFEDTTSRVTIEARPMGPSDEDGSELLVNGHVAWFFGCAKFARQLQGALAEALSKSGC